MLIHIRCGASCPAPTLQNPCNRHESLCLPRSQALIRVRPTFMISPVLSRPAESRHQPTCDLQVLLRTRRPARRPRISRPATETSRPGGRPSWSPLVSRPQGHRSAFSGSVAGVHWLPLGVRTFLPRPCTPRGFPIRLQWLSARNRFRKSRSSETKSRRCDRPTQREQLMTLRPEAAGRLRRRITCLPRSGQSLRSRRR